MQIPNKLFLTFLLFFSFAQTPLFCFSASASTSITRAEFITLLMQSVDGAEDLATEAMQFHYKHRHTYVRFTDVPVSAEYAPAVSWAYTTGLIQGRGDGLFHPTASLTRAEAAKLITSTFLTTADLDNLPPSYADIDPTAWYIPYLGAVVTNGIMSGYDSTDSTPHLFGLSDSLTTAEADLIIERSLDLQSVDPVDSDSLPEDTTTGGTIKVLLDPSLTANYSLAANTADIEFLRLQIISDSVDQGAVITGLQIRRRGLGLDSEISNIRAYIDDTEISQKNGLNSEHCVQLYFRPAIILDPGEAVTLSILADLQGEQTGSTYHSFEVTSYQSWSTLDDSYIITNPNLRGPEYQRISVENGQLVYAMLETNPDLSLGKRKTTLAEASIEARYEDIKITRIVFENQGSLDRNQLDSLKLTIGRSTRGELIGSTDEDEFIFDLSDSPYLLEENTRKTITLTGTITGGSSETIAFTIPTVGGISGIGTKYDLGVSVSRSELSATDIVHTVDGGSLTVDEGANNPGGYTIYAGDRLATIAVFEFESSGEELLIEDLHFDLATENFDDFTFEEISFRWGGKEIDTFAPSSDSSQTIDLDETLTLPANRTRQLTVRAKIAETLSAETGTFQLTWHALSDSSANFRATRQSNDDTLGRSEILPSGSLAVKGGKFKVKGSD